MDFLGNVNIFHGRTNQGQAILDNLRVRLSDPSIPNGEQARVYVRPNDIIIDRTPQGPSSMPAKVTRINRAGVQAKLSLEPLQQKRNPHGHQPGSTFGIQFATRG